MADEGLQEIRRRAAAEPGDWALALQLARAEERAGREEPLYLVGEVVVNFGAGRYRVELEQERGLVDVDETTKTRCVPLGTRVPVFMRTHFLFMLGTCS